MVRIALIGVALTGWTMVMAAAQTPSPPYYAMPGPAVTPSSPSPLQQQIIENYRTQLLQTQRDQLLQNPSGLGREQIDVTHQLNNLNAQPQAASPVSAPAARPSVPPAYYRLAVPPTGAEPLPVVRHAARHSPAAAKSSEPALPR